MVSIIMSKQNIRFQSKLEH